ncbi:MAG: ABC transporter permease subunit, partial [Treponema socranskii subsp. buccale]
PMGIRLYSSTIIPNRGAWIELETDTNGIVYARIDRNRKIPATVLIRALGWPTNDDIMQLSNALTGSVLAETVFSWPGIGRLIVDSISKRDTPMVTGAIIMSCVLMVVVNLVIDLIYAFFDPRIKAQYAKKG